MKYKYKMLVTVLVLSTQAILFTKTTDAAIFKCVNEQGATFYNDKPCPKENVETQMKAVKAPKDPYIPQKFNAEKLNNDDKVNGVFISESLKNVEINNKRKSSGKTHNVAKNDASTTSVRQESSVQSESSNSDNKYMSQAALNSAEPPGIIE